MTQIRFHFVGPVIKNYPVFSVYRTKFNASNPNGVYTQMWPSSTYLRHNDTIELEFDVENGPGIDVEETINLNSIGIYGIGGTYAHPGVFENNWNFVKVSDYRFKFTKYNLDFQNDNEFKKDGNFNISLTLVDIYGNTSEKTFNTFGVFGEYDLDNGSGNTSTINNDYDIPLLFDLYSDSIAAELEANNYNQLYNYNGISRSDQSKGTLNLDYVGDTINFTTTEIQNDAYLKVPIGAYRPYGNLILHNLYNTPAGQAVNGGVWDVQRQEYVHGGNNYYNAYAWNMRWAWYVDYTFSKNADQDVSDHSFPWVYRHEAYNVQWHSAQQNVYRAGTEPVSLFDVEMNTGSLKYNADIYDTWKTNQYVDDIVFDWESGNTYYCYWSFYYGNDTGLNARSSLCYQAVTPISIQ